MRSIEIKQLQIKSEFNQDKKLTEKFEPFQKLINELNKKSIKKVTFIDEDGYGLKEDVFKDAAIVQNQYERINLLQDKFKELGDGCKEVLELSWSGLAMDEVAKKLQNSYGYVRKKKSECMAKLIALVKKSPQFVTLQW